MHFYHPLSLIYRLLVGICCFYLTGQHSKILDKTVYPGGRIFLHPDDALRQDTTFPSGLVEEETVTLRSSNVEISDARYLDLLKHEGQNEG